MSSSTDKTLVEGLLKSGGLLTLTNLCYLLVIGLETTVFFYDNVPISAQVLPIAICCIIIGSFHSVSNHWSNTQEVEQMTAKDAYLFPVMGSAVLCSAYVFIRYLPSWIFDYSIRLLFYAVATFSAQSFMSQLLSQFAPKALGDALLDIHLVNILIQWKYFSYLGKKIEFFTPRQVTFPATLPPSPDSNGASNGDNGDSTNDSENGVDNSDTAISCHVSDVITLLIGFVVSTVWFTSQHWLANNIIGIATSIQAVALLNPGSYYTATVLLSLLFFYDIFWVFGTDVMVTVAKNLNAPIKLIFPRPAEMDKPSMLGLGDIVLPGIYIALILRYDIARYLKLKNSTKSKDGNEVSYSTWYVCIACYLAALGNCLIIMYYFEHAQPALLYLVPACILPILAMAYFRGDLMTLWKYDEAPSDPANSKKAQ